MRYFKYHDKNGIVIAFGIGYGGMEITEIEYNSLMDKFQRTQAATAAIMSNELAIDSVNEDIHENVRRKLIIQFAYKVYAGRSIDIVPETLKSDVQSRVDSMIENFGPFDSEEISDSEALDIILGGETA